MNSELLPDGCTILEPHKLYDRALLGTVAGVSCYDQDLLIELIMESKQIGVEDAVDWFDFNVDSIQGICFLETYRS